MEGRHVTAAGGARWRGCSDHLVVGGHRNPPLVDIRNCPETANSVTERDWTLPVPGYWGWSRPPSAAGRVRSCPGSCWSRALSSRLQCSRGVCGV